MEKKNIIVHRVNTIKSLKSVDTDLGCEIDIRTDGSQLILNHDPFKKGDNFIDYLDEYQHGTLVLNIKETGIEKDVLDEVKKRKIRAYNELQWNTLAENLSFTVDGNSMKGQWLAIDHPANGKAAEGFFVYMVSFQFETSPELKDGSTIVMHNAAYPDSPMVYTASATASPPWSVASSTAQEILGEGEKSELTDPKRWSEDARLRTLTVTVQSRP